MWICTKGGSLPKIQNYETMKGGYLYQVKKVQNTKNIKLYTSDINFKLLYAGCPIAHAFTNTMGVAMHAESLPKELTGLHVKHLSRFQLPLESVNNHA